jgi:hypothetical protein
MMSTFHHRGKEIEDEPDDVAEARRDLSHREFGRRSLAELIGIQHSCKVLIERAEVLQDEIHKRILKIEAKLLPPPVKKAKKARKAHGPH